MCLHNQTESLLQNFNSSQWICSYNELSNMCEKVWDLLKSKLYNQRDVKER